MIGQKIKNYSSFNLLAKNRKILLDWALWCTSRGIDNFSLSRIFGQYGNGKLSINWVEICNFRRIKHKTEEEEHSKVQKMTARRAYIVIVLRTGSDKFRQVWTSQNMCEALFFLNRESHAVQIWPSPQTCAQFSNCVSLETLRPSEVVETALRHASIGVRCELVWSATFLGSTSKSNTSLESSRLAEFECEISLGYDLRQKSYCFR